MGSPALVAHRGLRYAGKLALVGTKGPGETARAAAAHRNHGDFDWCLCGHRAGAIHRGYRRFVLCVGRWVEMARNPVRQGFLCAVFYSGLSCGRELPVQTGHCLGIADVRRHWVPDGGPSDSQCTGSTRQPEGWLEAPGFAATENPASGCPAVCLFPTYGATLECSVGVRPGPQRDFGYHATRRYFQSGPE